MIDRAPRFHSILYQISLLILSKAHRAHMGHKDQLIWEKKFE